MSVVEFWPNFFIVGAPKAGTTSLYAYLRQHPDVYMSPVKEPHFFSRVSASKPFGTVLFQPIVNRRTYLKLFRDGRQHAIVGEASTSYLWDNGAAGRILSVNPRAKILISLRDPVERAYSHYLNNVREGIEERPFSVAIHEEQSSQLCDWLRSYVDIGRYTNQVRRYRDLFAEQVKVVVFEEFVADPIPMMNSLCDFLNLDASCLDRISYGVYNRHDWRPRNRLSRHVMQNVMLRRIAETTTPQRLRDRVGELLVVPAEKPLLPEAARDELEAIYEPDGKSLVALLKRPLPWVSSE